MVVVSDLSVHKIINLIIHSQPHFFIVVGWGGVKLCPNAPSASASLIIISVQTTNLWNLQAIMSGVRSCWLGPSSLKMRWEP